jgi:hypothetical protein
VVAYKARVSPHFLPSFQAPFAEDGIVRMTPEDDALSRAVDVRIERVQLEQVRPIPILPCPISLSRRS